MTPSPPRLAADSCPFGKIAALPGVSADGPAAAMVNRPQSGRVTLADAMLLEQDDDRQKAASNSLVGVIHLREEDLRRIVRQHGFRVKALAVHLGMTVRTLERRFLLELGMNPKVWLVRERMRLSVRLLTERIPNKQIAAALGYTSDSNFYRDFKRWHGCAPTAYARGVRFSHTLNS